MTSKAWLVVTILIVVIIVGLALPVVIKLLRRLVRLLRIISAMDGYMQTAAVRYDKTMQLGKTTFYRLKDVQKDIKRLDLMQYRQVEALIELNGLLGFNLSGLRGFAISPDAGLLLYKSILDHKPQTVVELGGGLSSVIIAQALKTNGRGRLISIDHLEDFAAETKRRLAETGLATHAEVRVAALKPLKKGGSSWYDTKVARQGMTKIDYLVVDGPPEATNAKARQAAVPQFRDLLAADVQIFMDDYNRPDEQATAQAWLKLLPDHHITTYDTELGTAIIKLR